MTPDGDPTGDESIESKRVSSQRGDDGRLLRFIALHILFTDDATAQEPRGLVVELFGDQGFGEIGEGVHEEGGKDHTLK
jgi:hypothetical protein